MSSTTIDDLLGIKTRANTEQRQLPLRLLENPGDAESIAMRASTLDQLTFLVERAIDLVKHREAEREVGRRLAEVHRLELEVAQIGEARRAALSACSQAQDAELRDLVSRGLLPRTFIEKPLSELAWHERKLIDKYQFSLDRAFQAEAGRTNLFALDDQLDAAWRNLTSASTALKVAREACDRAARACGLEPDAED